MENFLSQNPTDQAYFSHEFSILNLHDMHTLQLGIDYEFGNITVNVLA